MQIPRRNRLRVYRNCAMLLIHKFYVRKPTFNRGRVNAQLSDAGTAGVNATHAHNGRTAADLQPLHLRRSLPRRLSRTAARIYARARALMRRDEIHQTIPSAIMASRNDWLTRRPGALYRLSSVLSIKVNFNLGLILLFRFLLS